MNIYLPENLVETEAKISALWMKVTCEMKVNEELLLPDSILRKKKILEMKEKVCSSQIFRSKYFGKEYLCLC